MPETLESLAKTEVWVCWKVVNNTKVPYSPRTGAPAKTNDSRTWSVRDVALAGVSEVGPACGIGVVITRLPSGMLLCGIDLDTCVADGVVAAWASEIVERFASYTEVSPSGTGVKTFFLCSEETSESFRRNNGSSGSAVFRERGEGRHRPAIELYTSGRYFTVTGQRVGEVDWLREVELGDLEWLIKEAGPRFLGIERRNGNGHGEDVVITIEDVAAAFRVIPNGDDGWENWNNHGMAIFALTNGDEEGYEIFREYSERAMVYDATETRRRWEHWRRSPPKHMRATTIIRWARDVEPGWIPPSWRASDVSPPFSEDWLALRFVDEHVTEARYTAAWGQWSRWDGHRWARDDKNLIAAWARKYCRSAARESNKRRAALASSKTVSSVISLARVDQRINLGTSAWDADSWLLATPGGTVDLRTGTLRESDPNDYMSKVTSAAPMTGCPTWLTFVTQACGGDREFVSFLQRSAGYWLTGQVNEETMFFFYGTGGNGKGTFLESVLHAMGDYATTVAMTTLVQSKHQEHPTEIAKLFGVRLAVAQETEEGVRWNIARIKTLTGADSLTARFMRMDYFDFRPTHKLVVSSNRKPMLGRVDAAISRRMHLIPFTQSFVGREDRELKGRLREESGGILWWMVEGCREWMARGLVPPKVVADATAEYLHDQDDTQVWLDECCVKVDGQQATASELYVSWTSWCERSGAYVGSRKLFAEAISSRFKTRRGTGNALVVLGVRLADEFEKIGVEADVHDF